MKTNYDRMRDRRCWKFTPGTVHTAICACGDYYWEHSHRWDPPRSWVLIRDDERERMRARWYEEINTRRYRMRVERSRRRVT